MICHIQSIGDVGTQLDSDIVPAGAKWAVTSQFMIHPNLSRQNLPCEK